mmetsp:Transcript_12977/g.30845  ORF Transcript_12977/g.30845 Transcript_12977/m.30845 type:complete len:241 (-) Transcript_12977:1144-1866(-)
MPAGQSSRIRAAFKNFPRSASFPTTDGSGPPSPRPRTRSMPPSSPCTRPNCPMIGPTFSTTRRAAPCSVRRRTFTTAPNRRSCPALPASRPCSASMPPRVSPMPSPPPWPLPRRRAVHRRPSWRPPLTIWPTWSTPRAPPASPRASNCSTRTRPAMSWASVIWWMTLTTLSAKPTDPWPFCRGPIPTAKPVSFGVPSPTVPVWASDEASRSSWRIWPWSSPRPCSLSRRCTSASTTACTT